VCRRALSADPRDNGFYPLFEQQASVAVDTAIQLEKLMASLPIVSDRSTPLSPQNEPATK
jgi:hypothetical protein